MNDIIRERRAKVIEALDALAEVDDDILDMMEAFIKECRAHNQPEEPDPLAAPADEGPDKFPAYNDDDLMPFGKHKNLRISDVPASYLHYLWTKRPISDKRLEGYIRNNINHLKKEYPDGIWT